MNASKSKTILFVCTGNSCRSQMAEGFARKLLPKTWRVFSAEILVPDSVIAPSLVSSDTSVATFRLMRPLTVPWMTRSSSPEISPSMTIELPMTVCAPLRGALAFSMPAMA